MLMFHYMFNLLVLSFGYLRSMFAFSNDCRGLSWTLLRDWLLFCWMPLSTSVRSFSLIMFVVVLGFLMCIVLRLHSFGLKLTIYVRLDNFCLTSPFDQTLAGFRFIYTSSPMFKLFSFLVPLSKYFLLLIRCWSIRCGTFATTCWSVFLFGMPQFGHRQSVF